MKIMKWIFLATVIFGGLLLFACSSVPQTVVYEEPAILVPIAGTNFYEITLTVRAAERLDIQTSLVREEQINGVAYLVIPYSALIYGLNGDTWVYISPASLTYHREPIIIDFIEGDMLILAEGPPIGTEVVTVGVAELYGVDTGIGN